MNSRRDFVIEDLNQYLNWLDDPLACSEYAVNRKCAEGVDGPANPCRYCGGYGDRCRHCQPNDAGNAP